MHFQAKYNLTNGEKTTIIYRVDVEVITLLVDVSRALKDPGQSYPFDATAEIEPLVVLDDLVRFSAVSLEGEMVGAGDSVRVSVSVEADVETRCSLCLEPVTLHLSAEIDALFAREPDPDDPDQYPLDGYKIETNDLAREALLLEMPLRILCKEDCKGICPSCGTNLNKAPCTCQEGGERQNPFSALRELLTEDEEV